MKQNLINDAFFKEIPWRWKISYNTRFLLEHFFGFGVLKKCFRKWDTKNQTNLLKHVSDIERELLKVPSFSSDVDPSKIRKEYVRKGIPVVIRGGAITWEAYKKWDFEFFRDQYGHHPVILTNHQDLGDEEQFESINSNLREIIEGLDQNSMKYARFNPLLDTYPELQMDLDQTWLDCVRDTKIKKHHVLFVGNKGTKTNIHNAGNDNVFVQIRGKKKWFLWDQRSYYVLNPAVNRGPAKATSINPKLDTCLECPAYNHLPMYELTLEEADILLVPAYLWHFVENLTPTIGLGNRWLSPHNTINNNPLFAFLEMFNTAPSIFTTLNWRKGFDFNTIMLKNMGKKKKD